MLNLFSYGDSDPEEDNRNVELVICNDVIDSEKDKVEKEEEKIITKSETKKEKSLFSALPKVKKSKEKKQLNLAEIAKFAQVPVEELRKEFNEEHEVSKASKPTNSLFNVLPKPEKQKKQQSEEESIQKEDVSLLSDNEEVQSNGVIPLNPFLDDADAIQREEKDKPVVYTTVYHVPQRKREHSDVSESEATPSYGYVSQETESMEPTVGYGSNYSQRQYEAFMRRSGMLATADAKTTSSANMLGEDAQFYDKQTKQALETGNVIELNQNDLHDHSAQPGSEYWERKKRKAAVASQFGKYAHIAPTPVQQTRNQITYLASQAIEQLADIDSRRAQIRKTRREVRSKYGW